MIVRVMVVQTKNCLPISNRGGLCIENCFVLGSVFIIHSFLAPNYALGISESHKL